MHEPTAAAFAVEIDRLVIGIHRAVFDTYRDEIRLLLEPLDAAAPGQLLDLAEFLIDEAFTTEIARLRFRYDAPLSLRDTVDSWLASGLVTAAGGASPDLKPALDLVLARRALIADSIWHTEVSGAKSRASQALESAHGALTDPFRGLPEPASPALGLHHCLTGLRYARMDAHAEAWQEAGLDAAAMVALAEARATGTISARDHAVWEAVERDTNERCEPLFEAVDECDAWSRELAVLPDSLPTEYRKD